MEDLETGAESGGFTERERNKKRENGNAQTGLQ